MKPTDAPGAPSPAAGDGPATASQVEDLATVEKIERFAAAAARDVAIQAAGAAAVSVDVILTRLGRMEEDRRTDADHFKDGMAAVLEQAKITNGRVTKLELWKAGKDAVSAAIGIGRAAGISVFVGVTIGLAVKFL